MDYYDALETRESDQRERDQFEALRRQLAYAKANAPACFAILADIEPGDVVDRKSLSLLPVVRKSDLIGRQADNPPFGGLVTLSPENLGRVFQSPGPIYEPQSRRADYWRLARAMFAAGMRAGDLVHNAFSYHMTPAGSMFETGADALGCAVFPAGVGQTELQVRAMVDLQPSAYAGTPSFLNIVLDKVDEMGAPVSSLKNGLVSGEALPGSLRSRFEFRGIDVLQCYATADLGLIAYETQAREGLVVDEGVIVEIVRPGTGQPVEPGEVGEVLVTTLNPDYPLIRFATGDLSAVLDGQSPCGRSNMRIKGWLGRADQTTKIRGMFVHPEQVAAVIRRHREIRRARLVVTREGDRDVMTLLCERTGDARELASAVAESVREVCKLRGEVQFVNARELPNDGKVIDDQRSYD